MDLSKGCSGGSLQCVKALTHPLIPSYLEEHPKELSLLTFHHCDQNTRQEQYK